MVTDDKSVHKVSFPLMLSLIHLSSTQKITFDDVLPISTSGDQRPRKPAEIKLTTICFYDITASFMAPETNTDHKF